jgi:hypothetical protein
LRHISYYSIISVQKPRNMKKFSILLFLVIFMDLVILAQYSKPKIDAEIAKKCLVNIHPQKSEIMTVKEVWSSNVNGNLPDWNPILTGFSKSHELSDDVQRLVDEKTALKIKDKKNYTPLEPVSAGLVSPTIGASFQSNIFAYSTPSDNSMAISNGGYIVSVINSTLNYYDMTGTLLYSSSFSNFFNDADLAGLLYDPVVLYDSGSDRFFMVILSTTTSTTSKVVCCFSKSNNPNDGWWYYKLSGNPLNNTCWFDYPKIGVSNNEVYVTGNLFHDAGTWSESVIYQMTKVSGYAGQNLNWQYWHNITNTPFTMVPASYGREGTYGPGIMLVSTHASSPFNIFYLFDITADLTGSPQLIVYSISGTYNASGNALQSGSSIVLSTDDTRTMSAFYLEGIIHFVFHSERTPNYYGIDYNRLTVSNFSIWNVNFGADGYDYCYPSIASFSPANSDKSVMIAFLRSGSTIFPETRVFYVDDAGNTSGSTLVKEGETYVDVYHNASGVTRWGDYTGISRKQNSSSPEVWLSGSYGALQSGKQALNSWICQVNGLSQGLPDLNAKAKNAKVFPNPVMDIFRVEFTMDRKASVEISILDGSGRNVKLLLKDMSEEGKNVFSFNKGALSTGIYFLQIKSENTILANEKIVIE